MMNNVELVFNSFNNIVKTLLSQEANIQQISVENVQDNIDFKLEHTNIIINSLINDKICFIFAFQKELIEKIFLEYTKELDLGDDYDLDMYLMETGSDFANIVIGHMLKFFDCPKKPTISVPYTIANNHSLVNNVKLYTIIVHTEYGVLKLYFIEDNIKKNDVNSYQHFILSEKIA